MTRILVLSTTTGYQLRSFGSAADRLGIEIVFATDRCHRLDDPWRDHAVAVRFHDEAASLEAIVRSALERPIDGVLAVGDRPAILAARAAEALGIRGNPPAAAAASVNKRLARERFAAAGLAVPWFFEARAGDDPLSDPRLRYPCVVKPLGLSGSRGVIRANTPPELADALSRVRGILSRKDVQAIRSGLEHTVLVEGFIPGREFAIEGVLTNGTLQTFAIFDKPDPLDGPFFEETVYVTPSQLSASQQRDVLGHVQKAAHALGLTHGPVHAELRISDDGIYMLEVAPRPIGGLCSKVVRFAGGEVSLEEVLLRHARGEDVTRYEREAAASAVMMIPIPKRGIFRRVHGVEEARATAGIDDIIISAKQDQLLERLPEAGSYLGFIFARGLEPDAAVAALTRAHAALRFEIETPIRVIPSA